MVGTTHHGGTPHKSLHPRGFICGLLGLLLAGPAPLGGQQGTITYTHSVNLDVELPPELAMMGLDIPPAVSQDMLLHFEPSASLLVPAPKKKARTREGMFEMRMVAEMSMFLSMRGMGKKASVSRSPAAESYVDLGEGRMVETHQFMGRTFRVVHQRPEYQWRLTGEQAEHLGYMVIKATAEHDSTAIEAWFTPQIPVAGGPGRYGGLPGMILVVSVDHGHTKYFATEIALGDVEEGLIRRPEKGDEMSQEEYDDMVEEKTEEMRKRFGARRRGNGGGR
ncbi:MAG: GLPGLI family protein [Gemmatimonadota bacterium]|nr:GLPGLI family protein [Gemmatimonadota bacterium]MDE2871656.1 GLPGLI family protein [Gemmatimonadota bacterium]